MKTVNLQVRINEDLKQEVSSILKAQALSYTSMLDALFRQIIKERRIPFAIALPTTPTEKHQRQVHSRMTAPTNNLEEH